MCDEEKSQLQIRGSFGVDSGSVSIEDTTLGIVSWSDSLIICDLPDSGKGAGGGVIVQTIKGQSSKRMLSIFSLNIDHPFWWLDHGSGQGKWYFIYHRIWEVSWRTDISTRPINIEQTIKF